MSGFTAYETFKNISPSLKKAVVAIGNFDGVHLGHQAVLNEALTLAKSDNYPAIVLTFEPHPRTYFKPNQPVFRLTNTHEKSTLIAALGFDAIIHAPFDRCFSEMAADQFVKEILVDSLQVTTVVTGYDFHFGRQRHGTPQSLQKAGMTHNFKVQIVEKHADEGDDAISSSRVRQHLEVGNVAAANSLLNYHWFVTSTVIHGQKRGRELGFPTANMKLAPDCQLKYGVYAVRVLLPNGDSVAAVSSYGCRPHFDNGLPLLETYIPNFSGDLYHQALSIQFIKYLRDEQKFSSTSDLIKQMQLDTDEALLCVSQASNLSMLDEKIHRLREYDS